MKFSIGQRVKHQVFGKGTVTHIQERGDQIAALVTVQFDHITESVTNADGKKVICEAKTRRFLGSTNLLHEVTSGQP